jgi:uncharacterized protein YkwD
MSLRKVPHRILPFILFGLLTLIQAQHAINPGPKDSLSQFRRIESKLLLLINRERKRHRLNPICFFHALNRIAYRQSEKMAKTGQFSHFLPGSGGLAQRLKSNRLFFIRCGENLALSDVPLASLIHGELMGSPDHRSNILNPDFTHCGIRISTNRKKFYITQTFAQLFDPESDSKAEFHLLEGLELWFVKNLNYRFVFHHQSRDYARMMSRKFLSGKNALDPIRKWGNLHTFSMVYPDLDFIKDKLKAEIMNIRLEAISIGIASGRTRNYPGGAFAVTALLFGDYHHNSPPRDLARVLLNQLNRIRREEKRPALKLDNTRSRQALKLLNSTARSEKRPDYSGKHIRILFSMTNPYRIPGNVQKILRESGRIRAEIGIGISSPKRKTSVPGSFRVCLLFQRT